MKNKKLNSIKKFYFLEYFGILLESIAFSETKEEAFELFRLHKENKQLGESRYKKIAPIGDELSESQFIHYQYTFLQVIDEALQYDLIKRGNKNYNLTDLGKEIFEKYVADSQEDFNHAIFKLMENKIGGFRYLIDACYKANPGKNGLLIFPIYSPLKLNILKADIRITRDIYREI